MSSGAIYTKLNQYIPFWKTFEIQLFAMSGSICYIFQNHKIIRSNSKTRRCHCSQANNVQNGEVEGGTGGKVDRAPWYRGADEALPTRETTQRRFLSSD